MAKVKYSGVAIGAGDTLIVPALSFRQLKENAALLDSTGNPEVSAQDRVAAKVEVIHLALTRNYPDLALDKMDDFLDLSNIADAFDAALGASKEAKTQGED